MSWLGDIDKDWCCVGVVLCDTVIITLKVEEKERLTPNPNALEVIEML